MLTTQQRRFDSNSKNERSQLVQLGNCAIERCPYTSYRTTEGCNDDARLYDVPNYDICNRYLAKWVKKTGIRKKITWHCGRHSFAVNVLTKGANIKTVSSLLGHTSVRMTERSLNVVDSLKQDAINSLGDINYAVV